MLNKAKIVLEYEVPSEGFCSYPNRDPFEAVYCDYLDTNHLRCEVFRKDVGLYKDGEWAGDYVKCEQCLKALREL